MPVLSVSTVSEFEALLQKAKAEKKGVFVDFFAEWCGPCKMVAPKIEELSSSYPAIVFVKIDVDKAPELAQKFGVRAMPTFVAFYDGEKVEEIVGANLGKIGEAIEKINKGAAVPA